MKTLFIISIHSFIDVITNSSTELFVCNTDKTVETVEEILKKLLSTLSEADIMIPVFEECMTVNKCSVDVVERKCEGYGFDSELLKDEVIVVEGVYDNSIPYELFDLIASVFNADRYHLG